MQRLGLGLHQGILSWLMPADEFNAVTGSDGRRKIYVPQHGAVKGTVVAVTQEGLFNRALRRWSGQRHHPANVLLRVQEMTDHRDGNQTAVDNPNAFESVKLFRLNARDVADHGPVDPRQFQPGDTVTFEVSGSEGGGYLQSKLERAFVTGVASHEQRKSWRSFTQWRIDAYHAEVLRKGQKYLDDMWNGDVGKAFALMP